ncbi:FecR domain-containing protein [Microvirga sp. G4-2]|uniref:FecR domain-containing protein n=1 Tax=Microvirga sp. G4-2 TaxID=3434467 RepID=UPI00404505E3
MTLQSVGDGARASRLSGWWIVIAALGGFLTPGPTQAQVSGCTLQRSGSPSRQVLRCQDGLQIEAESGADYALVDRDSDGRPDEVNLRNRALLIEAEPSSRGTGFQVRTPVAIAAVRGTQWVVDVAEGKTAVFVLSGRVAVRRSGARAGVELGPGEGVDVDSGRAPLTVRRWPIARANALLERFGRQIR